MSDEVIRVPAEVVDSGERTGNRYPESTRRLAMQLWANVCDRNCTAVAQVLHEDHGIDVHPETIRAWKNKERWSDQINAQIREFAPDLHAVTVSKIVRAMPMVTDKMLAIIEATDPRNPSKAQTDVILGVAHGIGILNASRALDLPQTAATEAELEGKSLTQKMSELRERLLAEKAGE